MKTRRTRNILTIAAALLALVIGSEGADINVVIPGGGSGSFSTNINVYGTTLGYTKSLRITPQTCYHFKATPGSASDRLTVVNGTINNCEANYTMTLTSTNRQGWIAVSGQIEPSSECGSCGTGGGGTAQSKDYAVSVTQRVAWAYFTVPSNGTNLTACCGTTNDLELKVLLGDGGIPSAGTVNFSAPTTLGSFTSNNITLSPSGLAATKFAASTNAGSDTITANATGLKDEGGKTVPGVSTNLATTVAKVYLDIDGVAEEEKVNPGAVVVRNYDNNNAPRKMLILFAQPSSWTNNLLFTRNNTKVRIFTARTNGTEVTFNGMDNKFLTTTLPTNLWVEGATASDSTNDVELVLTPESPSTCPDKVRFTVLWVAITGKFSSAESIADDDSAKDYYSGLAVPSRTSLGPGQFTDRMGWGTELVGSVFPTNFIPNVKLSRDAQAKYYTNSTYVADQKGFSESIPPGNDEDTRDPAPSRDDDPQSGGSKGKIYDVDAPGTATHITAPQGEVRRNRANFKEFAVFDNTRCSEIYKWYCKVSYTNSGASASGTATSYSDNTTSDTNRNWTADQWKGGTVYLWSPVLGENYRIISGNTATSITVTENWTFESGHIVFYTINGTNTWTPATDVTGDNDAGARDPFL